MKKSYKRLLEGNKEWSELKLTEDKEYFKKLSKEQRPQYLWIGCSDSRVPANEVTKTNSGEIFVHRNIANLVIQTDMNLLSVLYFAVDILHVKHVIVCGHYKCGGIKAAMQNKDHGFVIDKSEAVKILGDNIVKHNTHEYELGNSVYQFLNLLSTFAGYTNHNFYFIGGLESEPTLLERQK